MALDIPVGVKGRGIGVGAVGIEHFLLFVAAVYI